MLICCCIAIVAATVVAQKNDSIANKSHVQIVVGGQENEADVEQAFSDNIPRDKSVAGMPHFAIVGKYKRFYLGIGANFKASAAFDFGDEMPSELDFVPSSIMPKTPGNGGETRFSAQASSIYLNFVAMPGNPNKTGLFFSGNFKGENYGFKINHFYIKYRGLKLGYTNSAFADNDAVPYTIDDQGACGQANMKLVNAMWTQPLGKRLSVAVGIDAPTVGYDSIGYNDVVKQRVPAIPLWLQYGDEDSHIRLSGLVKVVQYRDLHENMNRNVVGWGLQLSGNYEICRNLKLYYGTTYGEGIASYIQDGSGLNVDLLASATDEGRMEMTPAWASHLGAEIKFNDKIESNLLYSRTNMFYDRGVVKQPDMFRYSQYVAANLLYNITYFVKLGVEYNWGFRSSIDGRADHTNRLQGLLSIEI